ncbi:MAG: NUDIX domain-containing protein [Firmicutes bacterium]|nr:NUDIX domain-containing protein [Bacillota bacterium]
MRYKFCPQCGTELTEKEIGDEGLVPFCPQCSRPWFDSFATCIIALVVNDEGECVLMREANISKQYHNLVSGFMKPGENAEETATREVEEETGLKVEAIEHAGTYWYGKKDMLMIGFFAKAKKAELVPSCEIDSAEWVPFEKALTMVAPKGAISYALIEKYIETYCKK